MTQNGIEVDRVTAVVPSYSYVSPVGDTILATGRDYAVSVSVKAPGLAAGSDQLYLNGSAVVVAAAVREEHGIIAEGEGKTHLAKPLTKDAALTLSNLTLNDKYNYSLQLVVGETVHNTIPYTLDEHGLPQLTFGQLMLDAAAEMPTSYTVLLTAADKNAADNIVYLGKTVTVLNVLAE